MNTQKRHSRRTWLLGLRLMLAAAIGIGPAVPAFGTSLKDIPVIEPTNLHAFVKGAPGTPEAAAAKKNLVVLGKALFWDMQVGSDNVQACASCHFNAGTDTRATNQLNPGSNASGGAFPTPVPDTVFGNSRIAGVPGPGIAPFDFPFAPNTQLLPGHFPFHLRSNPTTLVVNPVTGATEAVGTLRDTNDVVSSQGVRKGDLATPVSDDLFHAGGANQRRVAGRNAPSALNGAFTVDTFWDGRASFIFNGQNPFGFRDRDARVKRNIGTVAAPNVQPVRVRIPFAALASQAVGPPGSTSEMTGNPRDFPQLADKLLAPGTKVLGLQMVHPDDSVLGPYAKATPGTNLTYLKLIQDTFRDEWWNGGPTQVRENFALFFGLAVQAYESTLVSDDTPYDKLQGAKKAVREGNIAIPADPNALTRQEKLGLDIFRGTNEFGDNLDPNAEVEFPKPPDPNEPEPEALPLGLVDGGCFQCHALPETTNHTVRLAGAINPAIIIPPVTGAPFEPRVTSGGPTDLENVVVPQVVTEAMPMGIVPPVDPAILAPYEDPQSLGSFQLTPQFFSDNPEFLVGYALYDVGYYNAGVRPTGEDLSRAKSGPVTTGFPDGLPLAYTTLADMLRDQTLRSVEESDVVAFVPPIRPIFGAIEVPLTAPLASTKQKLALVYGVPSSGLAPATRGAFKVPNLRNQEFQGPYMHNGGQASLRQVVEFYARGGDFPTTNAAERDGDLIGIPGMSVALPGQQKTPEECIEALVAFLSHGLTDDRVKYERAPFDHPQLFVPNGANGTQDRLIELKATGRQGKTTPISRFLNVNPTAPSHDVTPPTTTANAQPSYVGQATITLAATDMTGVQRTEYSLDGGAWTAGTAVHVTALGPHTLNFRSTDLRANPEAPKAVAFTVTDTTQLSAKISVTKPKYDQRTTVSGVLRRGSNGAPIAGVPVFVQSSTNGKTWKTVTTRVTDAQGAVSASVLPRSATHYRLAHGAKAGFFGGQGSGSVKAVPQVSLSKPSGPSKARSGKAFTSTGFLKPKHASGSKQVLIKAYRWNGKKWVYKKTIKAKATNFKSYTKYTARLSLTKGTWRIRAHHPADSLNASTYTAYRKIKVR